MATSPTNMSKQLKYTGKGYLDYKIQPVNTVSELREKFVAFNELKLGLTVTVLNENGDNVPIDYWYYYPYDEETQTYDTSVAPDWYPKVYLNSFLWQDGGTPGEPDFESWKEECVL